MNPSTLAIGSIVAVFIECILLFCEIDGADSFLAASFVLLIMYISVVKK